MGNLVLTVGTVMAIVVGATTGYPPPHSVRSPATGTKLANLSLVVLRACEHTKRKLVGFVKIVLRNAEQPQLIFSCHRL